MKQCTLPNSQKKKKKRGLLFTKTQFKFESLSHYNVIKKSLILAGMTDLTMSLELPMKYGGHFLNLTKKQRKEKKNAVMNIDTL